MRPLNIDLHVAFFGSPSVNAVLGLCHDGRADGIAAGLVATHPLVVRVFDCTKLDEILVLYPSLEAVLQVRDPETL